MYMYRPMCVYICTRVYRCVFAVGDRQGRPLPSGCRQHAGSPACSPSQGSAGGIQEPIGGPAAPRALGRPRVPEPRALCPQRSGSKHASTPADNYYLARRRTLQVVVSSLLTEAGFESAEKAAVETLTEMLQSCECPQCHSGPPRLLVSLFSNCPTHYVSSQLHILRCCQNK